MKPKPILALAGLPLAALAAAALAAPPPSAPVAAQKPYPVKGRTASPAPILIIGCATTPARIRTCSPI